MFGRGFRSFLIFALGVAGMVAGLAVRADDYPVLRSNRLAYVIGRAEWDLPRNAVYLTDQTSNRVVRLNLDTGEESGAVGFTRKPEAVRLSPDGTRLYVATLANASGGTGGNDQRGFLQIIDAAEFRQIDEMRLEISPYSLAVRDDGVVVAGGGLGTQARLDTYQTRTRELTGFSTELDSIGSVLTPHPDQTRLYATYGGQLLRFDPDPVTGYYRMTGGRSSTYGELFIFPGGARAVTALTAVFDLHDRAAEDLVPAGRLTGLPPDEVLSFETLAFDRVNDTFFTARQDVLSRFNSTSLVKAGSGRAGRRIRWLSVGGDNLFAVTAPAGTNGSALLKFPNPASGGATNLPPDAALAVSPDAPTTLDTVRFDAGVTMDDGPADALRFQWDWNADGVYDTGFSSNSVAFRQFNIPGTYTVGVRVMDRFGTVASATRTVSVTLREDAGAPMTNAVPFALPFVAARILYDPVRPVAYATDYASRRLVTMDMDTGRTLRSFSFAHTPESMAITSDGLWLYVALPVRSPDYAGQASGYIAEFDLVEGRKTREFEINNDPKKLAVTDARRLIIIPASGLSMGMVYNAMLASEVWRFPCSFASDLVLVPGQASFLVTDPHSGGCEMSRYAVNPTAGGTPNRLQYVTLPDSGPFLATPDWHHIIGWHGGIYDMRQDTIPSAPARYLEAIRPDILLMDAPEGRALFTATGTELRFFNIATFNLVRTIPLPRVPKSLGRTGRRLFYSANTATDTVLAEIPNPALGMETNDWPWMSVEVSPAMVRVPVTFDAGGSIDDEDGLLFRWDLDGDGVFERGWTNSPTASRTFIAGGDYFVRGEVRDLWGETGQWLRTIHVENRIDPGETPAVSEPWRLPFEAADVAFDPVRRHLWAADRAGRAVVRVNLTNGLTEKRWSFPQPPESLAMTPDGRFLYATMVDPTRDTSLDPNSYVAEFDLRGDVWRRSIGIDADPTDIAVNDGGQIYIATRNSIHNRRVQDGYSSQSFTWTESTARRLRLSPDGRLLYSVNPSIHPGFALMRIHCEEEGFLGALDQSPFAAGLSAAGSRVFLLQGGTRVLDGAGNIYTNIPGHPHDLQVGRSIGPVLDCVELPGAGEVLVTDGSASADYYRADTMQPASRVRTGKPIRYAGAFADRHFLVGISDGATVISPRIRPGTNAVANLPPRVRWLRPGPGRSFPENFGVNLEAEPDDLDGSVERVTFYHAGREIGSASEYPFRFAMYDFPPGTNEVIAVATDNLGAASQPATNTVLITRRPVVTWVSPQAPALYDRGDSYTLEVGVSHADGVVRVVNFYASRGLEGWMGSATNPPWRITLTNFTQTTQFVAVALDEEGTGGSSPFLWLQLAGATGDEYYRPFELQGEPAVFRTSNTNAGAQFFEGAVIGSQPYHSLWWTWTAPSSGVFRVSTAGSDFDTLLGVYADSEDIATLAPLAVNDDDPENAPASSARFVAIRGETYRIVVDGAGGATGNIVLSLGLESASPPVALLHIRSDGVPEISYEGYLPATAIIMASPDLKTWGPVITNAYMPGQRITLPPQEDGQQFYKLVFP